MFNFDLKISSKSDNKKLILSLPILFYLTFSLISLIILLSIFFAGYSLLSIILLLVSLIIVSYRESWSFNKESNEVTYITGACLVYVKKNIPKKDIESIELTKIEKGNRNKITESDDKNKKLFNQRFYTLVIFLNNGLESTVFTMHEREKAKVETICTEIENITNITITR